VKRFLRAAGLLVAGSLSAAVADDATLDGFRMHYEDRGRGEPVVFLHGVTLDSRMWRGQRGFARRHRMVVADMRFHGRSSAPEDSALTAADAAEDVRALLDRLKIDRAHLVGLSMGGGYALETALRHPERVLSLTLVSPSIQGI
jgi:pimeloyl-ACP methyl ester carboxylesterase